MALGSFSTGALSEVDAVDVAKMLELGETLFVEHKAKLDPDNAYSIASAIAGFANTLGGWVLLGVEKARPIGTAQDWAAGAAPTLGDALRDRLRSLVDPLPTFEAKVVTLDGGDEVGVVRVYESADTPHVMVTTGAVYVREGAGRRDASKTGDATATVPRRSERLYQAMVVGNRAQLVELAQKGERSRERVRRLFDPSGALPTAETIGLRFEQLSNVAYAVRAQVPEGVFVRVAPYTLPPRFRAWATTAEATSAIIDAAERLSGIRGLVHGWARARADGAWLEVSERLPQFPDSLTGPMKGRVLVAVSNDGVIGTSLCLWRDDTGPGASAFHPPQFGERYIASVLAAAVGVLSHGEFFGRALARIHIVSAGTAMKIHTTTASAPDPRFTLDVDVTVPPAPGDLDQVALRTANALARTTGAPYWDTPT